MVVRVRLRIEGRGVTKEVVALVNSGYEADTPQLMIPHTLARELGYWPPPPEARELVFDTAGGPIRVWYIPKAIKTRIVSDNASSKEVLADLVISMTIDEPLISDMLTSEFEIVIEDVKKGLWRFKWESSDRVRESAEK